MNPTGIKSRFWEKLVRVSPPFDGPEAEARRNVTSHKWQSVHFHLHYDEADEGWAPIEDCRICGVLAGSERSRYPCGAAPHALKLNDWLLETSK